MTSIHPAGPGLQPERTALAWQRLGLTQTTLGLTLPRIAHGHLTPAVIALSGLGAALGLLVIYLSRHRHTRHHPGTTVTAAAAPTDGRLPLIAAAAALLTAAGVIYLTAS